MKKLVLIFIGLFLPLAGTIFSQTPQVHGVEQKVNQKKPVGIDLSLWRKISTQPNDSVGSACLNVGVFSTMNNLVGVGLNVLGSIVQHDVQGLQIAGLWNLTGQSIRGVQLAGITNVNGDNLAGVSVSGLVGINGNRTRGIQISGLVNINGDENDGCSIGGLMNLSGNQTRGAQFSGMSNITGLNFEGAAVAGLLNVAGGDATGVQFSGLSNITVGCMRGVQMAPVNIAVRAKGVQIGLFNYYKERLDGIQLGLVNANPNTRVQLMLYGGNSAKLNVAARFKNHLFYTVLGTDMPYLKFSNKFSGSLFYRAGLELPVYKRLYVSGDLGFQHIETFKNKNVGYPARLYSLQGRVNLEYRFTDRVGLFVTGGYGWDRYYTRNANYDKGILMEGGIVLFKY